MKIFKKIKMIKVSEMSVPCAVLLSGIVTGLIIGISIFLTTWIFFGGENNRQKLFMKNPAVNNLNRNGQPNTLTPEQIKQMQEAQRQKIQQQQEEARRAAQEIQVINSTTTETE
jgi:hypothetical protein